jgi:hypothetical protein
MRLVIQVDFSTAGDDLALGEIDFENDLTRLYLGVGAQKVWSKQIATGRVDFVLCELGGPSEITPIAKRIYDNVRVRPVFLPEKQTNSLFGF